MIRKLAVAGRALVRLVTGKMVVGQGKRVYLPQHLLNRIPGNLDETLNRIRQQMEESGDLKVRSLRLADTRLAIVYIPELVDQSALELGVINPLTVEARKLEAAGTQVLAEPTWIEENLLSTRDVRHVPDLENVIWSLLDGETVLLGSGWREALAFDTVTKEKRPISEPQGEINVRGPREGFVERLDTNMAIIRQKIRHPKLKIIKLRIGRLTRTAISVIYIEGLARPEIVSEVMSRLRRIDTDAILESGYLEEFLEDSPFSPFPQIGSTERPDRAVAALLEGEVVVLTDGTPYALIMPFPALGFAQTSEDYYQRWVGTVLTRSLRVLSMLVSAFLPAFYIALTTFHPEMVPRPLVIAIAAQRETIPYPAVVEGILMILAHELITEATLRLPRSMGQTVSILGTLIIGETAVRANLVSSAMVIIIAIMALSQFTVMHPLTLTVRLLRVPLFILASTLGLFGIFVGTILIILHLASLKTFGVPYLVPYAPLDVGDMKDATVRVPWWAMVKRPSITGASNPTRMAQSLRPGPPSPQGQSMEVQKDMSVVEKPREESHLFYGHSTTRTLRRHRVRPGSARGKAVEDPERTDCT